MVWCPNSVSLLLLSTCSSDWQSCYIFSMLSPEMRPNKYELSFVTATRCPSLLCSAGCFHEDGLADTIDGFGGGWARSEILAIMKDSRVGTYALVGTVLAQHLKLRCLAALPNPVAALLVAHCASRWVVLPIQHFSVYIQVCVSLGALLLAAGTYIP